MADTLPASFVRQSENFLLAAEAIIFKAEVVAQLAQSKANHVSVAIQEKRFHLWLQFFVAVICHNQNHEVEMRKVWFVSTENYWPSENQTSFVALGTPPIAENRFHGFSTEAHSGYHTADLESPADSGASRVK